MENKTKIEEQVQKTAVDYSPEELAYRSMLIKRLEFARDQRNEEHNEFNDMDYLTYHETNAKAANSYIEPKKNKEDVRIVTGTTEEKETTLLAALLNYNLEPNIEAFDKDDLPIVELGENIEAMVKKSREIEDYDAKKQLIYKEMLDQGNCFVEELWTEKFQVVKDYKPDWSEGIKISKQQWNERLEKVFEGCSVNLMSGTKVYLGDLKKFDEREQPYLFYADQMSYDEAKTIYGSWERWEYVPKKVVRVIDNSEEINIMYRDWSLLETTADRVEIIKYQDKPNNEFMIIINGVMMLPIGFPLTTISPSGEYTLVKGDASPISAFFAYSKSTPAKTKVDQQVLDQFLKLIILKTQQSFKPPMANNTGRVLSKNIFNPATIHNNIDVTKLVPIITPTGVTAPEFSAFQFIKQLVDEKSVNSVFSGDNTKQQQTATEVIELKKQQMMKLGNVIWGVIQLEKKLAWLRIQNLLENWTKEIDEKIDPVKNEIVNVYRSISVNTNLENGRKGLRMIEFNPEMTEQLTPEQIMAEEDFLSKSMNKPVRKTYMNPLELSSIRMKTKWYITIVPTEKDSSELNRVLFVQNIKDAAMIFGIQSLNMDYLKERFAVLAKEDPDKFFVQGMGMDPMMGMGQENMDQTGAQMMKGAMKPAQQPSLNALVK